MVAIDCAKHGSSLLLPLLWQQVPHQLHSNSMSFEAPLQDACFLYTEVAAP